MMKKTLSLILSMILLLPSTSFADNNKADNSEIGISGKLINDALKERNSLDLSPINKDYKSGQKASPLQINESEDRTSERAAIPRKFDLRKLNRVSPVRRQGSNGSCWAFAAYGSMESFLKPYGNYDFSEKHLRNKHGFDWGNEDGGNRDIATAYFARGDGPINEEDDPYEDNNFNSPDGLERSLDIEKVLYIRDKMNGTDTRDIKKAIMEYGGVYTVINSSKYYESTKYKSYYNPGSGKADHAVTIVGWDDDFSKNAFTKTAPGNGAWICKNSWGSGYMDGGYYYVSYYDNYAGTGNAVFIPKKKDNSAFIYQYDPLGATRSVGYAGKGYMANIFTAKRDETLKEVGLYNVSAETKYKIYLVEDINKTSQLDTDKKEIASGVLNEPGYYTVDVNRINLKKGKNFALVAYMDSSDQGYRYPMPVEARIKDFSSKASSENNQSFVSSDGKSWSDLNKALPNANACIKAITTTIDKKDFNFSGGNNTNPTDDKDKKDDQKPNDDSSIKIKEISFAEGNLGYIDVSKKGQLTTLIKPENSSEKVSFKSSKPNICVVDKEKGILYPREYGNVNIVAKSESGKVSKVFNLQVVPVGLRVQGRAEVTVIGENDYIPPENEKDDKDKKDTDKNEEKPSDGNRPGEDTIKTDPKIPRDINVSLNKITLHEEDVLNLEEEVSLYPKEAEKKLTYISDNPSIADVDENGNLCALSKGSTKITIVTHNNLKTSVNVEVLERTDPTGLNIIEMKNTDRKAGIFSIQMKAEYNSKPYNGGATLKLVSDDRVIERKIYFNNGKAESKYTGFDFGVWRNKYNAELKVKDQVSTCEFDFSKIEEDVQTDKERSVSKVELTNFETSERKAGVFNINMQAEDESGPYTGPAKLIISSGDRTLEKDIEFKEGNSKETFTGFDFGVWRNDYNCQIKFGDDSFETEFSFE